MADSDKLALIANVAANYLRRNSVGVDQISIVMSSVTRAIEQAARALETGTAMSGEAQPAAAEDKREPAVPIRRSVQQDAITCLECGIRAKTLKRHLQAAHGLTPQQYRERWGLSRDYPMAAPAYAAKRSEMAKALGLGQKMREARAKKGASAKRGARRKGRAAAE
jgi:predicted transcriptional regulator